MSPLGFLTVIFGLLWASTLVAVLACRKHRSAPEQADRPNAPNMLLVRLWACTSPMVGTMLIMLALRPFYFQKSFAIGVALCGILGIGWTFVLLSRVTAEREFLSGDPWLDFAKEVGAKMSLTIRTVKRQENRFAAVSLAGNESLRLSSGLLDNFDKREIEALIARRVALKRIVRTKAKYALFIACIVGLLVLAGVTDRVWVVPIAEVAIVIFSRLLFRPTFKQMVRGDAYAAWIVGDPKIVGRAIAKQAEWNAKQVGSRQAAKPYEPSKDLRRRLSILEGLQAPTFDPEAIA